MLLNISYNDIKQKKEIDKLVGKPFSIKERLKMGGIGSEKLIISSGSINIKNLLLLDNNINKCFKEKNIISKVPITILAVRILVLAKYFIL